MHKFKILENQESLFSVNWMMSMLFIYFCNYFAVNESFVCCRRRSEQWDARKFRYFAFKM